MSESIIGSGYSASKVHRPALQSGERQFMYRICLQPLWTNSGPMGKVLQGGIN